MNPEEGAASLLWKGDHNTVRKGNNDTDALVTSAHVDNGKHKETQNMQSASC